MQFDSFRRAAAGLDWQVTAFRFRVRDGDMTAMPDSCPTITTLRPGCAACEARKALLSIVVTGGFAEISFDGVVGSGRNAPCLR